MLLTTFVLTHSPTLLLTHSLTLLPTLTVAAAVADCSYVEVPIGDATQAIEVSAFDRLGTYSSVTFRHGSTIINPAE